MKEIEELKKRVQGVREDFIVLQKAITKFLRILGEVEKDIENIRAGKNA